MEARLRSLAFTTNYTHVSPSRKVFPSNRSFLIVTGPTISNRFSSFSEILNSSVSLSLSFSRSRHFFFKGIVKEGERAIKGDLICDCSDTVVSSVFLEGEMKRNNWNSRFVKGFPFVACVHNPFHLALYL